MNEPKMNSGKSSTRAGGRAIALGGPMFEIKHKSRCLQKSELTEWGEARPLLVPALSSTQDRAGAKGGLVPQSTRLPPPNQPLIVYSRQQLLCLISNILDPPDKRLAPPSRLLWLRSSVISGAIVPYPEMGIYRDNFLAIVIGDNFLPIIVIAQKSLDLSITDIAFVIAFVIADKLSR